MLWGTREQACLCLRIGERFLEKHLKRLIGSPCGDEWGRKELRRMKGLELGKPPREQDFATALWPRHLDEAPNHLKYQLLKNYQVMLVA